MKGMEIVLVNSGIYDYNDRINIARNLLVDEVVWLTLWLGFVGLVLLEGHGRSE